MIQLTKEQLNFMSIYTLWMDKDQAFRLTGKKGNDKIIFTQRSQKGLLISTIDYNVKEDFDYNFDTDIFVSLVKSLPNEIQITITDKGIEFLKNKYDIKNYDIMFEDFDEQLKEINTKDPRDVIPLVDIEKFKYIKDSVGVDDLAAVAFQKNHFITSDRINYTSFIKTDLKFTEPFYFASDLFLLLSSLNINSRNIIISGDRKSPDYYYVTIDNTSVFFIKKDYALPDMFDPETMKMYEHKYKFEVNKSQLKIILDRMKIVARANRDSRIFIELKENEIIIRNNDNQLAYEKLDAIVDKPVVDLNFAISAIYFSQVLTYLQGDKVLCFCTDNEEDFVTLKIIDEKENNFYVISLLEG